MTVSCLYVGEVTHQRQTPVRHSLRYNVTSLYLDLEEDPGVRLFSRNRFNLFSVRDRDLATAAMPHGPAAWARDLLAGRGIDTAGGAVRVHLFPRVLGLGFTPLTTWFCHHRDGALAAILYEVHNTFGERHIYLAPAAGAGTQFHQADKCFHVSPFIGLNGLYRFALRPPDERYSLIIRETDRTRGDRVMVATHHARRRPLTDAALLRAALTFPLPPLKILGGIHWEALRLWIKGAPFFPKPPPPAMAVSVAPALPETVAVTAPHDRDSIA